MTPALHALLRGDLREAQRTATAADQIAILAATKSSQLAQTLLAETTNAFVAALANDFEGAKLLLTPDAFHGDDAQLACEAVLVLGDASLVPQALAAVDGLPVRDDLRPIATLRGDLYLLAGRVDEAIRDIEEGLALARAQGAVPYVADAAAALARALDARAAPGDRDRAVVLAAEAQELWHRCSVAL